MKFRSHIAVFGFSALTLLGCGQSEPHSQASAPSVRLLTEVQYRNIISDLFGPQIVVAGRFDPLLRTNGLSTVGAWNAPITPAGLEQYEKMARAISAQIVSSTNRDAFVPCKPHALGLPDDACAREFLGRVGRMLVRRPMSADQLDGTVEIANAATKVMGDFYDGLGVGIASILVSSPFLYITDTVEADPGRAGALRLDGYAKASRLSFLLWNSSPDDKLLKAAEHGELDTKSGVNRQVSRMMASPHFDTGVRAFFSDMLGFDAFDNLEKDSIIYRAFSLVVANDAKEQALRTISYHLINERGDYRDLFTTRRTFISGVLGRVYHVPVARPDGGWEPYEFPADDPRSGLITQIAFAALYAHPGSSSPTLRGRAIRESLLCQKVPDPPGNVDFTLFNDPNSPNKTARERLATHATSSACAGCHRIMDPIGLGLEALDGAGQLRKIEDGAPIDTSGDLDGVKFDGAAGLGRALRDNPATSACVVKRLYAYATGRDFVGNEGNELLKYYEQRFAADGYRIPDLLRRIVESDAFLSVANSPTGHKSDDESPRKSASLTGSSFAKENKL